MAMDPYTSAAGLVLGAGGAFLGGRAGDIKRKRLEAIANTPGLDTGKITGDALADLEKYLPQDISLAQKVTDANQSMLNKLYEENVPGFKNIQDQRASLIQDFLAGRLPADVQSSIERSSAAKGLGLGISGSPIQRNLTARDLGRTSLDLMNYGLGQVPGYFSSTPIASPTDPLTFAGPSPNQLINIRGQERAQKMNIMAQAAGIGGQTEAWANYLNQVGGALAGYGMGGGSFGGGGGSQNPYAFALQSQGGTVPSNFYGLSSGQQAGYVRAWNQYQNVNPYAYE